MIFDARQLAELEAAVGAETLAALLTAYREDLTQRLQALRDARTHESIRREAHGLRSGAATFGATALIDATRAFEEDRGDLAAIERAAAETAAALAVRFAAV